MNVVGSRHQVHIYVRPVSPDGSDGGYLKIDNLAQRLRYEPTVSGRKSCDYVVGVGRAHKSADDVFSKVVQPAISALSSPSPKGTAIILSGMSGSGKTELAKVRSEIREQATSH